MTNQTTSTDEIYDLSKSDKRPSSLFVPKPIRIRQVHSVETARRSTFAVVAQGLHFLRRKAPLHKLDRLARIGFPLLFIVCNCIYWYIFVFYTSN